MNHGLYRTTSYGVAGAALATIQSQTDHQMLQRIDSIAAHDQSQPQPQSQSQSTSNEKTTWEHVSADPIEKLFPERGTAAYLVVFGSFCGCFISAGLLNSIAPYNAYLETHQLSSSSSSSVSWIFGIYTFLTFFLGLQIGPLFDAYGPRWLVGTGSVCIIVAYLLLAECTAYWHFILVFSVLGGVGTSLVFNPSVAAIGHWFHLKRGTYTGVACVGGGLGGVVFPLVLQVLLGQNGVGWAWSQRIMALINLPFAVLANLLIRSRLTSDTPVNKKKILPDFGIFRDRLFLLVTVGVFFLEWGIFIPVGFLTSYALSIDINSALAYQLVAIFNAGSCFGRWLPGLIADRVGRFNTLAGTTIVCWLSCFAFWLPSELADSLPYNGRLALLMLFSIVFGFASGSGISLVPVCISQLCPIEEYGRYYTTCYTVVSFACLTGIPIAGSLVTATRGGYYWPMILFTGLVYMISMTVLISAKGLKTGFGRALWVTRF